MKTSLYILLSLFVSQFSYSRSLKFDFAVIEQSPPHRDILTIIAHDSAIDDHVGAVIFSFVINSDGKVDLKDSFNNNQNKTNFEKLYKYLESLFPRKLDLLVLRNQMDLAFNPEPFKWRKPQDLIILAAVFNDYQVTFTDIGEGWGKTFIYKQD